MDSTPAKWLLPTLTNTDTFSSLPTPRFQMVVKKLHDNGTWRYREWIYSLVYKNRDGQYLNRPFCQTTETVRTDNPNPIPFLENHEMPVRDGAHMLYEAKMLNVPAFLVMVDDGQVSTVPVFIP
jgi:hypothetical protein